MAQNTILNLYIKENILKINMKSMKKSKTLNYLNTVRSAEKNMAVFSIEALQSIIIFIV